MTKESLIVLCTSLCLSFTLPQEAEARGNGRAQTPPKEMRTANHPRFAADTMMLHGDRLLMADRVEIHKRIREQKKLREATIKDEIEQELNHEALEFPAEDLYGEDSWGGYVNPFAGKHVELPAEYDIDLGEFVMPTDKRRVTSSYGYRRRFGRHHHGTDIALHIGDTVRAAFSGKVRISSYEYRGYGNYIVMRHPNGLETIYGHLDRSLVREGMIVKAGDPIALGGNTGRSTGPHLHFETRFMGVSIDPETLFDFAEGTPRVDVYSFKKYQTKTSASHYAARTKAKRGESSSSHKSIATHRIKSGDTLGAIASRYGTTVKKICSANGITAKTILRPGKSLRIPS